MSDTRDLGAELVEQRLQERATKRAAWVSLARRNSRGLTALAFIAALVAVGWYAFGPTPTPPPQSAQVKHPTMQDLAGSKNLPEQRAKDYAEANRQESLAAQRANLSYSGDVAGVGENVDGKSKNGHMIVPPGGDATATATSPANMDTAPPALDTHVPQHSTGAIGKDGVGDKSTQSPSRNTQDMVQPDQGASAPSGIPSAALEARLFRVWDHHSLGVESGAMAEADERADNDPVHPLTTRAHQMSAASDSVSATGPQTARSETKPAETEKMLLPAGRGIYADMVTTADSDHPTEVFADVTSGPFAGGRLIGSFQKSGETALVVKFTRLVIGKQPEITVNGLAVAPDTMETFVASSVDEHLLTRALLPAAMEFASGLSQAIQNGNTTGISNGLGVTTFSKLNLPQELAVAGGTAAQGMLRILQQVTPQQSTVRLEARRTIGVIFVQAVKENV